MEKLKRSELETMIDRTKALSLDHYSYRDHTTMLLTIALTLLVTILQVLACGVEENAP